MLRAFRQWQASRLSRNEQRHFYEAFADVFDRPSDKAIRQWSDRQLHAKLSSNELHPIERSLAETELRRREAWKAPGGKAVWISSAALVVSIVALIISLYDQ